MDAVIPIDPQSTTGTTDQEREDPTQLLHRLLQENNLKVKVEALDEENPFIGNGFVLTSKPLLIIRAEYREESK